MRSGFTIGRDIMGTMSNTLVLAYIGSGLHVTLLFMTYYDNLEKVLSVEMITGEVLQALAGRHRYCLHDTGDHFCHRVPLLHHPQTPPSPVGKNGSVHS